MKPLLLTALFAASGLAQPALDLPRLGCLRDSADQLRIVFGVRGSFILSTAVATEVKAFFCSDTLIAAQTPGALVAFDQLGNEISRLDLDKDATIQFESDGKVLVGEQFLAFDGKQWTVQEGGSSGVRRPRLSAPKLASCTAKLEDSKLTLCEDTLPGLPPVLSVEQIGPDWLHIRTAEGSYAVTLRDRRPETYLLPANSPAPEERP